MDRQLIRLCWCLPWCGVQELSEEVVGTILTRLERLLGRQFIRFVTGAYAGHTPTRGVRVAATDACLRSLPYVCVRARSL